MAAAFQAGAFQGNGAFQLEAGAAVVEVANTGGWPEWERKLRAAPWTRNVFPDPPQPVTKAVRKVARRIEAKVVAELRTDDWFTNPALAKAAVEYVRTEVKDNVQRYLVEAGIENSIRLAVIRWLVEEARRIAVEQDDDEFLLLAA